MAGSEKLVAVNDFLLSRAEADCEVVVQKCEEPWIPCKNETYVWDWLRVSRVLQFWGLTKRRLGPNGSWEENSEKLLENPEWSWTKVLRCWLMHVSEEGSHLEQSPEWTSQFFNIAGLIWYAKKSPNPQLLKVKKDAEFYLGSKQEHRSSLHTFNNQHLKRWCPEKEIYIQKGNGLHHVFHVFNWW